MNKNKITDIKYYSTRSKDKNFYEAVARFYYNGKPVKYYIFVERKPGLTNKDYLAEAKSKFQLNLEKGIIEKYCRGIYPTTISRKKSITILAPLVVGAIVFAALFTWQAITRSKPEMVTFDAEDGTLELYGTKVVRIPYIENTTWAQFYPGSNYLGATKEGYDFICWSLDGENPIPNNYVIDKPIVLKPLYVKNRDCITISCRFFDERYPNEDAIYAADRDNYEYARNGGKFIPYEANKQLTDFVTGDYVSFRKVSDDEIPGEHITIVNNNSYSRTRFAISGPIDALTHKKNYLESEFNECFANNTGLCSASGLDLSGHPLTNNCFTSIFELCTNLLCAPELPATTLANNCYENMFKDCASLIQGPSIIPANDIPEEACRSMFTNCTHLVHAPDLSKIKTIKRLGCQRMFCFCQSLVFVEDFNPEVISQHSCSYMFDNCTSLKRGPKVLSANKHFEQNDDEYVVQDGIGNSCYQNMFSSCRSLIAAPEIGATIILDSQAPFKSMFENCTNLTSIKIHYTGNFSEINFSGWVNGVSNEGTFYYNGSDTTRGTSAIPEGWEIKTF